ncbi:MAG: hypothetical protein WD669_00870 [Pirellulales bacterium]
MPNLLRWQYVVPRVLAVVVALLALQYGLCLFTRARVVRTVTNTIGAPGELAAARASFVDGRVLLRGLHISDPRQPQRNLLQVDRCDLTFDVGSFLRRRALVGSGDLSDVQFLAPREACGALPGALPMSALSVAPFGDKDSQAVVDWIRELDAKFASGAVQEFESVQLTAQLSERGSQETAALQRRLGELETRAEQLRARAEAADLNPLRGGDFLASLPSDLAKLRAESAALVVEIDTLPERFESGRRAIVAARLRDDRLLRERLSMNASLAQPLASYLLHEQVNCFLSEMIGWIEWSRRIAPADRCSPAAAQTPDLLLHTLAVAGTACVGGQPVPLRGTLTDFTTQPWLLDRPMRLQLASTGSPAIRIRGAMDRSGPAARDDLLVDCQGLTLPPQVLGRSEGLRLSMERCTASFNVSIQLNGEDLSGEIQVVQNGVQLTTAVGDDLEHVPLAAALADTLGRIDSMATRLSLSGTLAEPRLSLWSSIGPAAATAMDIALRRAADERARQVMAASQRRIDEQLAHLDRQIADEQAELLPRLASSTGQFIELAARYAPPQRLDVQRLGRLPADSLFR